MKRKRCKLLFALIAVMLCLTAFSVTAFASGDDWCEWGDYGTPDTTETAAPSETPAPEETPAPSVKPDTGTSGGTTVAVTQPKPDTTENNGNANKDGSGTPLTPSGNLNLVDDVVQTVGGKPDGDSEGGTQSSKDDEPEEKQFITVQSKNGNYFYLIIDRSGDTENVHFLNQVDEADLMALIEGEKTEDTPAVCTCTDKCIVGDINLSCPVCQTTMIECAGKEPEPAPTEEPDVEPEPKGSKSGGAILLIVLVLAMAGGGALYYFKLRKPKADTKGPVDLDDYDFGEDEDDTDYEFEPDEDEQPGSGGAD